MIDLQTPVRWYKANRSWCRAVGAIILAGGLAWWNLITEVKSHGESIKLIVETVPSIQSDIKVQARQMEADKDAVRRELIDRATELRNRLDASDAANVQRDATAMASIASQLGDIKQTLGLLLGRSEARRQYTPFPGIRSAPNSGAKVLPVPPRVEEPIDPEDRGNRG